MTVIVTDPFGVPATVSGRLPVSVSVIDDTGKTVAAASTMSDHGVATLSLTLTKAGTFRLRAEAGDLLPAERDLAISPSTPARLGLSLEPVTIPADGRTSARPFRQQLRDPLTLAATKAGRFEPSQIAVQVTDRYGNTVDANRYDLQWGTVELEVVSTKGATLDQGAMLLVTGTGAERLTLRDHDGKAGVYDRIRRTSITMAVRPLYVDVYVAGSPARLAISTGGDKPISDGTDPIVQGVPVTVTVLDGNGRRLTALDGFPVDLVAESSYLKVFDESATSGGTTATSYTTGGLASFYVISDHTGSYYVHATVMVTDASAVSLDRNGQTGQVTVTAGDLASGLRLDALVRKAGGGPAAEKLGSSCPDCA